MLDLPHKGYSRLVVLDEAHVDIIYQELRLVDPDEYMLVPEHWVIANPNNERVDLVYCGKFEPNLIELMQRCMRRGVGFYLLTADAEEYEDYVHM